MTDFSDIISRLEMASEPDRELDLVIALALVPDVIVARQRDDDSGSDPFTYWEYTGSIDAAVALVARLKPFSWIRLDHWPDEAKGAVAAILPKPTPNSVMGAKASTLPLAVLLSLFRALRDAQREERDDA